MTSSIQADAFVQQLASRGVDQSTGSYGDHKVKIGKGSPIRLDAIKSANIPYAGFSKVEKVRRGKAGLEQNAGDALKTLCKPGTLDAKALLGQLKALQTHYERLDKLGVLNDFQRDSQLWLFTKALEGLSNSDLAAVFQSFTSSEMDLLQTALQREMQINPKADDAAHAANMLFDLQAMVIKEINNRTINAQIDEHPAEQIHGKAADEQRPQSLTDQFGRGADMFIMAGEERHNAPAVPGAADEGAPAPHAKDMTAYNLHALVETAAGSSTQREHDAVKQQSRLSARKIDDVTIKQMGDVLRSAPLTINIKTQFLVGGPNSILDHPNDPMVNIFHLKDQNIQAKTEGYIKERDTVEKQMFPQFEGHKINADERPIYGALNIEGRKSGLRSSTGYGTSTIILKPHVARRATYTLDDSFMAGKIAITPERRQNFYRMLDGSGLPENVIRALKDPDSEARRDLDAYLDKIATKNSTTHEFAQSFLPSSISQLVSDEDRQVIDHRFSLMGALLIQCFGTPEATQSAMATYDNLEHLVTQMRDPSGNSLALAAQKKNAGQSPNFFVAGAQYIEAQIHGPVIPSQDIAEIRINMDEVPEDERAVLRLRAQQYERQTGIKVTLTEDFDEQEFADDEAAARVESNLLSFNKKHTDLAAVESLKQQYINNIGEEIAKLANDLSGSSRLPKGALRLEGNALNAVASDFLKMVDDLRKNSVYVNDADPAYVVEHCFTETVKPVLQQKLALLLELESLASEQPPMTQTQKEAVTRWVVSSKALRSPGELRMIIKNARAQESLLRDAANADPPWTAEHLLQRMSRLVKTADADIAKFVHDNNLGSKFWTDELSNELDRMSFMGLALLQNGEPPMDRNAMQQLFARIGGQDVKNLAAQLEGVINALHLETAEDIDGHHVVQLKLMLELNAHNLGVQADRRFDLGVSPMPYELSLLQEPLRAVLREAAPTVGQRLDAEHPAYAPMPAPANPQAMPQNDADRRRFAVHIMDGYINHEKTFEKGTSVHGRGHIARCYIFANATSNMLEEQGIKVDKNAVMHSIAGHDSGRSGRGDDKWEQNSADITVNAMKSAYGENAMGQEYEQHIAGCIVHASPKNNTVEAMIMQAADSLDIGRTKDFDPERFQFLKGKNGEVPSNEAQRLREQLAVEADLLQRMTNPYCANRNLLFKMMTDAANAPTDEIAMFFQKQSEELQQQIADEFARDFDVSSEDYLKRFEDTIRQNPKMFPLLSKYYH